MTASRPGRLRVLHAINNLNYGGMERLLADIVEGVDPERIESHVLCLQYLGRYSLGLERSASLHLSPPLPSYSMVWPRPLVRLLRKLRPHIVHTHSGVWYKMALAARLAGVPRVIHTEHGRTPPDPLRNRALDRLGAALTDAVVAVSEVLRGTLIERHIAPAKRIWVIENGVDTRRFSPTPDTGRLRTEFGLDADVPVIGSIGRLEPVKGYDIMLQAFARLLADWRGPVRPCLVIAGEGSERARLEELASERGLGGCAYILGWRDDVRDLHSAFTIFTMSSRSEGTSVSLLEAMSAGICPVVTDVGGNRAVLGTGLAHRLVPSVDPAALAAAWTDALVAGERRHVDAEGARRRVQDTFSLERMVAKYEGLYWTQAGRAGVRPNVSPARVPLDVS